MRSLSCAFGLCMTLSVPSAPAAAEPLEIDSIRRNGALSRHAWQPAFATATIGGMNVRAGVAIGLRGHVRDNLDRRFAPAVSVDLQGGRSLSLLPARGGAMLVWQAQR